MLVVVVMDCTTDWRVVVTCEHAVIRCSNVMFLAVVVSLLVVLVVARLIRVMMKNVRLSKYRSTQVHCTIKAFPNVMQCTCPAPVYGVTLSLHLFHCLP